MVRNKKKFSLLRRAPCYPKNSFLCVWSKPSHDFPRHFRFPTWQLWLLIRMSHLARWKLHLIVSLPSSQKLLSQSAKALEKSREESCSLVACFLVQSSISFTDFCSEESAWVTLQSKMWCRTSCFKNGMLSSNKKGKSNSGIWAGKASPHLPKLTKLQCTSSWWCLLDLLSQCTVVLGFPSVWSNALPKNSPQTNITQKKLGEEKNRKAQVLTLLSK